MTSDKDALRQTMKARRNQLAGENTSIGETIAARFPEKLLERFGPHVSGYLPIGSEVDVQPLLQRLSKLGAELSLPRVEESGAMRFRAWRPSDPLEDGPFTLRQPLQSSEQVQPTLILLPMLAYAGFENRLGYGKGHYDRAIAELRKTGRVYACGVAVAGQEVERLPDEPHDVPLDWVVTENGSHPRFLQRAASPA